MNRIELAEKLREIREEAIKKLLAKVQKNVFRDNEKKLYAAKSLLAYTT